MKSLMRGMFRKAQSQVFSIILITGVLVAVIGSTYMWGVPLIEKGQSTSDNDKAEGLMVMLKEKIDDVSETGEQKIITLDLEGYLELTDDNSLRYSIITRGLSIATTAWVPLVGGSSPVQEDMAAVEANGGSGDVNINDDVRCTMNSSCIPDQIVLSACTDSSIDGTYTSGQSFVLNGDSYFVHHIDCADEVDGQALILGPEREKVGIIGVDDSGVIIAKSESAGESGFKTVYRLVYRELDDLSSSSKDGYRIQLTRDGNNILGPGLHRITIYRDESPKVSATRSKYGGDLIETKVYLSMS